MKAGSRRRDHGADLAPHLGLTGPGAWALAALYAVTFTTLAMLSGSGPMREPQGWIALGLVLVAAVALVLPGPYPLPLPLTVALLGVVAVSTAAIVWRLPTTGWPGWSGWIFGAVTFLLYMVALRGRVLLGALGMASVVGITVHWTIATLGDWRRGFDLTYMQVFSFCVVAFFALWLRRTARHVAGFREAEARRLAAEAALEGAASERRRHLDRVLELAGPALEDIAAGRVDAAARVEHGLLEAELRDRIRGRSLAAGPVPDAARHSRRRGAELVLLDDLAEADSTGLDLVAALDWAADRVRTVSGADATLRLARSGDRVTVTFATSDGVESFLVAPPVGDT